MTNKEFNEVLSNLLDNSSIIDTMKKLKKIHGESRIFGNNVRNLTKKEITKLQEQGNWAEDWDNFLVNMEFNPELIRNNYFYGRNIIGKFSGEKKIIDETTKLPSGIYKSTIINSEIGNECLIYNTGLISNYIFLDKSASFNVNSITASGTCLFGNGIEISPGNESGGREIKLFSEITVPIAQIVTENRGDEILLKDYSDFIESYKNAIESPWGIIEKNAVLLNTVKVENSFIGESSKIDGTQLISNSTIICSDEEPAEICHGAFVRNSCIQWGCGINSMAIVDESVLVEYSHVERHAKVTGSIIGANTGIAEGEVTASLIGPFVGFHHQAMLIAALWPEGRGNVGYGSNVGSNHTSKAPDQEIICGEGQFFGLGTNIKFPANYSGAPYSIIAAGVNTLPEKVEYPFSLINKPGETYNNISPAINEIFPAWVLYENLYMVMRNQDKYQKRDKSKRSGINHEIFRPDIIDRIILAKKRLTGISQNMNYYTEKDIPYLGKNIITEKSRLKGIEAYEQYIKYFALKNLFQLIKDAYKHGSILKIESILEEARACSTWNYVKSIYFKDNLKKKEIIGCLKKLSEINIKIAENCEKSKARDELRGEKIIDDYLLAHNPAKKDPFILKKWSEAKKQNKIIEELITKLAK